MGLTPDQVVAEAKKLYRVAQTERTRLDDVRRYWTGHQRLPAVIPTAAPREVRLMAQMARVNVITLVVESLAQSLAVEGFRSKTDETNSKVWDTWQANRFDARQAALHRAVVAYGVAYGVVTPGDPVPVIRGLSPRRLTAMYEVGDPDWPVYALERRSKEAWRLYDDTDVHELAGGDEESLKHVSSTAHNAGNTPVVRYLETQDSDWDDEPTDEAYQAINDTAGQRPVIGQVAPLMTLQDQVDLITFNLLVAQHFSAFRQRWVIGWVAEDETTRMKMGASQLWTFDEDPTAMKVGEFSETNLEGYLKSRDASFRHAASISQTPAHELIGELINLSADALAAAEAGRDRKVADRQTSIGESHEQLLGLAGKLGGVAVPTDAQVVWRDTGARSFSATVDALGKLKQMLDVPASELWDRVPGVTQQDVERWKAQQSQGDSLTRLGEILAERGGVIASGAGATGTGG